MNAFLSPFNLPSSAILQFIEWKNGAWKNIAIELKLTTI
jgi:hypothetical protein